MIEEIKKQIRQRLEGFGAERPQSDADSWIFSDEADGDICIDVNETPRDFKPTLNTNSRRDIKTGPSGNSYPAPKRSHR